MADKFYQNMAQGTPFREVIPSSENWTGGMINQTPLPPSPIVGPIDTHLDISPGGTTSTLSSLNTTPEPLLRSAAPSLVVELINYHVETNPGDTSSTLSSLTTTPEPLSRSASPFASPDATSSTLSSLKINREPLSCTPSPNRSPNSNRRYSTAESQHPPGPAMPVALVLILAHGKEWADPYHQSLKDQFYANKYDLFASTPASAYLSITRYNPSIIIVYGATTYDGTCNIRAIASRLHDFASFGGIVIFGGVPSAFTDPDEEDDDNVFRTAFDLKWVVGERMEMDVGDCSGQMQNNTLLLEATYLYEVPFGARLYRPLTNDPEPDEQCAVVVQQYGAGIMGYLGAVDLYCHDAKFVLIDMLKVAEGLKSGKFKKTPAEIMMGGKVWEPPGWNVNYLKPLTGRVAIANVATKETVENGTASGGLERGAAGDMVDQS